MLHEFLQASFPVTYRERAEEARKEEEERDVASPQEIRRDATRAMDDEQQQVERRTIPSMEQGGMPLCKDFACDVCGNLVYKPVILNCGHVLCMHHTESHGVIHNNNNSSSSSRGGGSPLKACPRCRAALHPVGEPVLCTQLWDWMTGVFPAQCEERANEVSALMSSCHVHEIPHTNRVSTTLQEGPCETEDYPEDFPHFGVGCDICGQYPILGQRFKCLDCPESVGFDLCRSCKSLGSTEGAEKMCVGRFNQRHQDSHRMELVPPIMTKLHTIKELHPDLDYTRLISLIEMAWEDNNASPTIHQGDEADDDDDDGQDDPMTDGSTMMHRRGPRPM